METLDYEETTEDFKRQIFDLNTMLDIGKTILSNLSLKDVLDIVLLTCGGHFHSSDTIILLADDHEEQPRFLWRGDKERIEIGSADPFIRYVKENQGVTRLENLKKDPSLKKTCKLLERSQVDLVIPLKFKGSINGILCLKKKQEEFGSAYTKEEMKYADVIAGFASVAIENAKLYEMATLDMKTRMYNHGFFKNRLIEEISRAERYKTDLILMMLDLDYFKKVNDTHGHMTGDHVLVKVADCIKQHVRLYDVAARFGGEEFSVILPETGSKDSHIVAERLRKSVEDLEFSSDHGTFRVSVSIGVADFVHSESMTEDILIERADRALYHAKSSGRNRVATYQEIAENARV
jgi:diguanylate cyclase (GGDEF)-like protein